MTLNQRGLRKLKKWIALLEEQGWSREDKNFLIDYWVAHHDEDGVVIAKGHPLYSAAVDKS